tara:strand:+ start:285 stop:497 length:213 start_codon:yes stop_codon:yes gene_type:complete
MIRNESDRIKRNEFYFLAADMGARGMYLQRDPVAGVTVFIPEGQPHGAGDTLADYFPELVYAMMVKDRKQ